MPSVLSSPIVLRLAPLYGYLIPVGLLLQGKFLCLLSQKLFIPPAVSISSHALF